MAIDVQREKLIGLFRAAMLVPPARDGARTHPSTLYRWITKGVRGVRLEGARIGGRLFTSAEAIQRFLDAQSADLGDVGGAAMAPIEQAAGLGNRSLLRPPTERQRASERAARELEAKWGGNVRSA